ncbi:1-acyl-sn-glycerol-3-phosphate acyltransferase [Candidatus Kirkpatrickella diaphorinae]|uniref:1-acyl-sn-glycerol-3-phosphate acyltransferase n=1 Tax=Candidatus Kirkpatrickella diaphorinae TaxID=2984322 RepID=A0ABY6GLT4_9PROT|nr:lysophospholipid acyltransferase family protein [Candidatus Kirkpatrickella diaphorinae]UYH52041.1 1-acyl-sn-glycerol-3-phosphate acyltransferase [Candidatus Kirkpatrickella diaphorinae]
MPHREETPPPIASAPPPGPSPVAKYGVRHTFSARLRSIYRIAEALLLTGLMAIPQSVLIRFDGWGKIWVARVYWATICRILGLEVRIIGTLAGKKRDRKAVERGEKPVIFVANHCSWLDIPVAGGALPTVFVAKQQIAEWPVIGTLARLGRTIFVSRQRNNTGRELYDMSSRLRAGDNLILFPEGTSSDGRDVLPFMSSFFAVAKPTGKTDEASLPPPVLIQPVSIVYDGLNGRDVGREDCEIFAWYGDMDLAPHIWQVTRWRRMRASILLHPPIDPTDYPDRKSLSAAVYDVVARGVRHLHEGRDGLPEPSEAAKPAAQKRAKPREMTQAFADNQV